MGKNSHESEVNFFIDTLNICLNQNDKCDENNSKNTNALPGIAL